jgi:hypothetical protein
VRRQSISLTPSSENRGDKDASPLESIPSCYACNATFVRHSFGMVGSPS